MHLIWKFGVYPNSDLKFHGMCEFQTMLWELLFRDFTVVLNIKLQRFSKTEEVIVGSLAN